MIVLHIHLMYCCIIIHDVLRRTNILLQNMKCVSRLLLRFIELNVFRLTRYLNENCSFVVASAIHFDYF